MPKEAYKKPGEFRIGVLDIMGSVEEHTAALQKCGVFVQSVKTPEDFDKVSGLIIPGGESTTIGKLLKLYKIDEAIRTRVKTGTLAVYGTCAGAILLAKHIENRKPDNLELMEITIERNAFGNQLESFETTLQINFDSASTSKTIPAVFIRAPRIKKLGPNVRVLSTYENEPVLVQEGNLLASTFHPEMTNDLTIHKYFIEMCRVIKVRQ